jgi:hypothetical protein
MEELDHPHAQSFPLLLHVGIPMLSVVLQLCHETTSSLRERPPLGDVAGISYGFLEPPWAAPLLGSSDTRESLCSVGAVTRSRRRSCITGVCRSLLLLEKVLQTLCSLHIIMPSP